MALSHKPVLTQAEINGGLGFSLAQSHFQGCSSGVRRAPWDDKTSRFQSNPEHNGFFPS